mgnify:CR=1 FL=1
MKAKQPPPNTIGPLLQWAYAQLGTENRNPRLDAEIIMAELLQQDRSYLYAHADQCLHFETVQRFQAQIKQRKQGQPVAYITGVRNFWSLRLRVNQHTLIPRPETEHLVEQSLTCNDGQTPLQVLDLGTGSGAIALALGKTCPHWQVTACDKSAKALEVAQLNTEFLSINNVDFIQSDWFSNLQGKFDLIVSNPPYVAQKDPCLTQDGLRFEPTNALVSGSDGLKDIRHIVANAGSYLTPGGSLFFDHGAQQKADCQALLKEHDYNDIFTYQDLAGHPRISGGHHG